MSERKYSILWLDDEPYYVESHADVINSDDRFRLIVERTVEGALDRIGDAGLELDLLIWDMILPPGPFDREEAEGGLRTGAVFFRIFRERFPNTPAILFTNVRISQVHELYHSPENGSKVYQKCDLLPEELVEKIEDVLGLEHREHSDS